MENKKLWTFGCSFTSYSWKTWADYLSYFYNDYENQGRGGLGNRFIFHHVLRLLDRIEEGDTVIIQWSGLLRKDILKNGNYLSVAEPYGEDEYTQSIIPDGYVEKMFSPEQKLFEFTNYSKSLKEILQNRNIKFKMFFMLNPLFKNNDLYTMGEPLSINSRPSHIRNTSILKLMNEKSFMFDKLKYEIENSDYIKPSLFEYQLLNSQYDNIGPNGQGDYHATSLTHLNYCFDHILPELNIIDKNEIYMDLKEIAIKEDSDYKKIWRK